MANLNYKTRERTDYLVIHCTGSTDDIGAREIRRQHIAKGYLDIGYHFIIKRDGLVEIGRPSDVPGGFSKDSVVICCVGADELTNEQALSLKTLIEQLMEEYPDARVYAKCDFRNFNFPTNQPRPGPAGSEPPA